MMRGSRGRWRRSADFSASRDWIRRHGVLGEHWTTYRSLAAKLGLSYEPHPEFGHQIYQDWEFTEADPEKLQSWLDILENDSTLSPQERTLLLSLLVSSYETARMNGIDVGAHRRRLIHALNAVPEDRARMEFFWRKPPCDPNDPDAGLLDELFEDIAPP